MNVPITQRILKEVEIDHLSLFLLSIVNWWAIEILRLADSGFFLNFLYQGGVRSTVFWVFEDLKFKISEGYDQNWCFPDSAQVAVSV